MEQRRLEQWAVRLCSKHVTVALPFIPLRPLSDRPCAGARKHKQPSALKLCAVQGKLGLPTHPGGRHPAMLRNLLQVTATGRLWKKPSPLPVHCPCHPARARNRRRLWLPWRQNGRRTGRGGPPTPAQPWVQPQPCWVAGVCPTAAASATLCSGCVLPGHTWKISWRKHWLPSTAALPTILLFCCPVLKP